MRLALSLLFGVLLGGGLLGCANSGRTGGCGGLCTASQTCCNGTCASVETDPVNCGTCGVACGAGMRCSARHCVPVGDGGAGVDGSSSTCTAHPMCSSSQRCCGPTCIDPSVPPGTDGRSNPSFNNCNACGIACDPVRASSCSVPGGSTTGRPRCMCGLYDQCLDGEMCNPSTIEGGFECISTMNDPQNCGSIGHACADGETCEGGTCHCGGSTSPACSAGQGCCADHCVDVTNDPMNCGACGNVCRSNGPACSGGTCHCGSSPACRMPATGGAGGLPFPLPGGGSADPGQLCCADTCVEQNSSNCASCGSTCTAPEECLVGGGLLSMGALEVCCAENGFEFLLVGCGGSGLPFPIPGFGDGGLPGLDGGLPFP